jgi:hypothetical protein
MRRRMREPASRGQSIARLVLDYWLDGFALHGAALLAVPPSPTKRAIAARPPSGR